MTDLAADKQMQYKEGVEQSIPMGASKEIFAGSLVCLDGTTRYAEHASDAANKVFVGIAREYKKDVAASAGAESILTRQRGRFLLDYYEADAAQEDVGKAVFVKDDQTVALAADVSHLIYVGVICEIESVTKVWVDIYPALLQTDVATHIADGSAAHAASAISHADAGAYFPAAIDTQEKINQDLAKGPFFLTIPRFTGWTKDGTAHAITTLPAIEFPLPVRVKRAYASVLTAPGTGKTLALTLGDDALCSIAEAAVVGEGESLDIAVAKDTDVVIKANETASGAGANCDLVLVYYKDDGE